MKKHFVLVAMVVVLGASLLGGFLGNRVSADATSQDVKDALFRKYSTVLHSIQMNAAGANQSAELVYSSLRQMLQQLDPHSSFFAPKEYSALQEENTGRYFGLGIRIRALTRGSGRIIVIEPPFPGTPAAKVGLQAGDVIYKVNSQSIDEWDTDDVVDHLKGPKGTQVHITVLRPGETKPLELDVTRDEIPKPTINFSYRIRPNIGYIKFEKFTENSSEELESALASLKPESLEGLILDLRDNPGGYLTQAIKVSQQFLYKGAPIVSTKDRGGKNEQKYAAVRGGNLTLPLVVLINGSSASASEIVAGALQDNDRGLIIGERSFGKGLVQSVYSLSDKSGLALTTGRYYTPSGRCLQRPFNGSLYEYYNNRTRKNIKTSEADVAFTLSKRKVYGGGGIQPDIVYKARDANRFELTMLSKDVFFKFANYAMRNGNSDLLGIQKEQGSSGAHFEVTDAVFNSFKDFLDGLKISYSDDEWKANSDFIRRGIKAEINIRLYGMLEGFKIRAEGDEQIQKALESIPQARSMLLKTKQFLANLRSRYSNTLYQDGL